MTTTPPAPAPAPATAAAAAAPTEPIAVRLVKVSFSTSIRRDAGGIPRVSPELVAEQGQLVRIIDVRDEAELCGPLGHIPSVTHVPLAKVGEVPGILDPDTCVIIVSNHAQRAGIAARLLEELGMRRVAAMEGGMSAWKLLGFATPRDPSSYRRQLRALPPGIGRDGKPLVSVEKGTKLSAQQIEDHIGDKTAVRWVKLAAFLLHGKRSCVDGRDDHGVIGTPGGDAGELLLALATLEQLTGKALSDDDVERILTKHVDTFGRFYMHSDTRAMNTMIVDGYRKDDRIQPHILHVDRAEEWRAFHKAPAAALRPFLLEHLVKPAHMGCGHLRFAMTVEEYGVRPELAAALLKAFHRLRWDGVQELEWVVLGGEHVEGAVANVVVDGGLHSFTRVPLISPSVSGVQMFVNHPQVTSFLRRELAELMGQIDLIAPARINELATSIEQLGGKQAGGTLSRLAKGLPLFELRFDLDGKPSVKQTGTI